MIPKIDTINYEGNLDLSQRIDFTISANKHMFDTLIKIYSDCVDSSIREVISNAWDAQVIKGNEKEPLLIILKDEFVVIDKGIGISPQKMKDVVSGYGESDKRNSDKVVGMRGLGYKAPFSISDQFTCHSIYEENGKRYKVAYLNSIDDKGGGIYLLGEPEETDQPTGTTLKVPIKNEYKQKVIAAIIKYTSYMSVRPRVVIEGRNDIEWPKILEETPNYVIYDKLQPYQINYEGIPYQSPYSHNIPAGFMFKFKVGELDLPPSRENVRGNYDLKLKMDNVIKEYEDNLTKKVEQDLQALPTLLDAIFYVNELEWQLSFLNQNLFYKGQLIKLDNIYSVYRAYSRTRYNEHVGWGELKKNNILLLESREKLESSYTKIKIGYHLNNSATKKLILLCEDQTGDPIAEALKPLAFTLSDIKLPKAKKYPKGQSRVDYNVQVRDWGRNNKRKVNITQGEYIYDHSRVPSDHFDGVTTCKIKNSGIIYKKVKQLPNWYTINQWWEKQLKDKGIKDEDLIEVLTYNNYEESIKDIIDAPKKKIDQDLIHFAKNNSLLKNEIKDNSKEVYKKYPLLKFISRPWQSQELKIYIKALKQYKEIIDGN